MDAPAMSPEHLNEDRGYQLLTVSILMIVLQLLAVGARLYARRLTKFSLALDDYLIIPALVTGIGFSCVGIVGAAIGHMGRHTDWVALNDPAKLDWCQKFILVIEVVQIPFPISLAKLSILVFFNRVFPIPDVRRASIAIGVVVVAHAIVVLLVAFFQCNPIPRAWDMEISGTCIDQMAWARYVSVPNILTDVALIILPLPVIWNIQTSRAQKIGLTVIFMLGGFNIVASAIRMSFFFATDPNPDPFWIANQLHIWCILEAGTAVVAACLPSIHPLLKRAMSRRTRKNDESPKVTPSSSSGGHWSPHAGPKREWAKGHPSYLPQAECDVPRKPVQLQSWDRNEGFPTVLVSQSDTFSTDVEAGALR